MVRFLISSAFSGAALVRGTRLLEGGAYSHLGVNNAALIRGWRLFETWSLLEEIR